MATPKVWAKIQPLENPANLLDITTEQLAVSMQERELRKFNEDSNVKNSKVSERDNTSGETYDASDTGDDEVIAYLLQAQFNHEYNAMLKRTEDKFNRDAKVNVSYSNYRNSSQETRDETESADPVNNDDVNRDIDRFVSVEKEYASIPRCGYKKMGKDSSQIITKHDMLMSSRINACRVLQFPPGIHTGDTGGFDMKLNNKVFNTLRAYSHAQCSKERAKVSPKSKVQTHPK